MVIFMTKHYYHSFNVFRLCCIILIAVSSFSFPFAEFEIVRPIFLFANGALFAMYGFLVLRDDIDFSKRIRRALKAFLIMFSANFVLVALQMWILYKQPFIFITKRSIFEFFVLNWWQPELGSNIWLIQSLLYALIIFRICRRFKDWDWLVCIITFAISIVLGEGSGIINFSFLGYNYIPGNFFTRAIPYLLLGRMMWKYADYIKKIKIYYILTILFFGIGLCYCEVYVLEILNLFRYSGHLIGFILITFALCALAIRNRKFGSGNVLSSHYTKIYKVIYYIYSPLAVYLDLLSLFMAIIFNRPEIYNMMFSGIGLIATILPGMIVGIYYVTKDFISKKKGKFKNFKISSITKKLPRTGVGIYYDIKKFISKKSKKRKKRKVKRTKK